MNNKFYFTTDVIKQNIELLSNIFRLAEHLQYPCFPSKFPQIEDIQAEFSRVLDFTDYADLLANGDSNMGIMQYGIHTSKSEFKSFNFDNNENKDFANCMFRYALLEFDGSNFAKLMSGLKLTEIPMDIIGHLKVIDKYNIPSMGLYNHPAFLVEYYKVLLGMRGFDYLDYSSVKVPFEDLIKLDELSEKQATKIKDFLFEKNCSSMDYSFNYLTDSYSTDLENLKLKFNININVCTAIISEFAVTHTKKIARKLGETYGYMLMQNMKFSIGIFAGRKNNFYNNAVKNFTYDVDNNDVFDTSHKHFNEYFISHYASLYLNALNELYRSKGHSDSKLDLSDLTLDIFGRIGSSIGTNYFKDLANKKLYVNFCDEKYTYESLQAQLNAMVFSELKGNKDFLSIALRQYIFTTYTSIQFFEPFGPIYTQFKNAIDQ